MGFFGWFNGDKYWRASKITESKIFLCKMLCEQKGV